MAIPTAIAVEGLSKCFPLRSTPAARLRAWRGDPEDRGEVAWALRDITFSVPRGASLGIVGPNGAGKSTLLSVLAGITSPTAGKHRIAGKCAAVLELGAGFQPELDGVENLVMHAALTGIPRRELRRQIPEIEAMLDLGPYFRRPLRTWSSGMSLRLGFAAAFLQKPEVLLLDEVTVVGDAAWQRGCWTRLDGMRGVGVTVVLATHSVALLSRLCDRALWLDAGRIVQEGAPAVVYSAYLDHVHCYRGPAIQPGPSAGIPAGRSSPLPWLKSIGLSRAGGREPCQRFRSRETADLRIAYCNPEGLGRWHLGVIVSRDDIGQVITTRSLEQGRWLSGPDDELIVRVPLNLVSGWYLVSVYLLDESCEVVVDSRGGWTQFQVNHEGPECGVFLPEVRWVRGDPAGLQCLPAPVGL